MAKEKKRKDPTYAALAAGPGSFQRAMEAALEQLPSTSPSAPELPVVDPQRSVDTLPQRLGPRERRMHDWADVPLAPDDASPAYRRVLEELSTHLVIQEAHAVLQACLAEEGCTPAEAIPYDLRAILVEALPRRLHQVLSPDRVTAAMDALEQALVGMHAPPVARRRRRSRDGFKGARRD